MTVRYRLVTFDAYSGLSDQRTSLLPAIAAAFDLSAERADAFLAHWRAGQLAAAALSNAVNHSAGRPRVPFRECTALALDRTVEMFGLDLPEDGREDLVRAWYPLTPWPEADAVLAALREKGYALAILSNGDADMLAALAAQYATPFDAVLSCDDAGVYKPHPAVYELPTSKLGIAREDYLHVAGGASDVIGARAAGVACYWSNRDGDTVLFPDWAADFERTDLRGLLDVLA